MDMLGHIVIVIPKGNLIVSSVAGTYKVLRTAIEDSGSKTQLIIAGPKRPGKYLDGLFSISPTMHWREIPHPNLIIIPAFVDNMPQVVNQNRSLIRWLAEQHQKGSYLASLCTGSFLLAEANLLNARQATTHWAYEDQFCRSYPQTNFQKNNIITEEDRIFTSGGAYSFLNLIIYLVERFYGRDTARKMVNIFQIDYIRKSQDRFVVFDTQKRHGDQAISKLQDFIERNYGRTISMQELCELSHLTGRSLTRRFKKATGNSPKQYQVRVRMEIAKELLMETKQQIKEIQFSVGYNDPKFFRSVFHKNTGMYPKEFRKSMLSSSEAI